MDSVCSSEHQLDDPARSYLDDMPLTILLKLLNLVAFFEAYVALLGYRSYESLKRPTGDITLIVLCPVTFSQEISMSFSFYSTEASFRYTNPTFLSRPEASTPDRA